MGDLSRLVGLVVVAFGQADGVAEGADVDETHAEGEEGGAGQEPYDNQGNGGAEPALAAEVVHEDGKEGADDVCAESLIDLFENGRAGGLGRRFCGFLREGGGDGKGRDQRKDGKSNRGREISHAWESPKRHGRDGNLG